MRTMLARGHLKTGRPGILLLAPLASFWVTPPPSIARAADAPQSSGAAAYYVSSTLGNDNWDGTSPERPWRTLDRASRAVLMPGDRLLLKRGDIFAGQLQVHSSGVAGHPLIISSYGSGPKPLIEGSPAKGIGHTSAILIRNQQQIEISDLEITNAMARAPAGTPNGWSFGIDFENDSGGILSHFHLTRLTIRNVFAPPIKINSENQFNKFAVSAIRFATTSKQSKSFPSFFRDIVIEDNSISLSGRFGVQIGHAGFGGGGGSAHTRDPDNGFNRDIVIRDNNFFELGGSAVQLGGARNALIDNNGFDYIGAKVVPERMVGRGSGAWVVNSRDVVAQHNRSRHIRGYKDSYGMHVDFGNLNVLYQYNYSEDSEGGFIEILGDNKNIIWRYNISVNDGFREQNGNTLWFSDWSPKRKPSDEIYIYNNTVFVRAPLSPDIDLRARHVHIWNNIFYASPGATIGQKTRLELAPNGLDLSGNLYFGSIGPAFEAKDRLPRKGDPRLSKPGALSADGYRLCQGSPAQGVGSTFHNPRFPAAASGIFGKISSQPQVDYFGTPLRADTAPDIGAAVPVARLDQIHSGCN